MEVKRSKLPKVDQQVIDEIVSRLLKAAPPGSKVILFGSHARGDADEHSDVDVMVVEPEVEDFTKEWGRLDNALAGSMVPVDLVVASQADFDYWKDTTNTLYYRAAREGRTYEAS